MNSMFEMQKTLNNNEAYKDLRKAVQEGFGINRDKVYDSKNPYSLIEKSYANLKINPSEYLEEHINDKNAPQWFNEITNEYIFLDMHGYQEDKINTQKGRKETFRNTTEDAFHAAFASMCNFYITNDEKSYKKTKQVYEKMQQNTIVVKPNEFVENYNNFINCNNIAKLNCVFWLLKNGEFYQEILEDNTLLEERYFPCYLFDFFNKLLIVNTKRKESSIILSQYIPPNGGVYLMEIKRLVSEICTLLGNDINKLGEIKEEEFKNEDWIGRIWKLENMTFKLIRLNRQFQLYIEFKRTRLQTLQFTVLKWWNILYQKLWVVKGTNTTNLISNLISPTKQPQ